MASVTALQLVNRTRYLRRQPPIEAFSTDEDTVSLNAVNMAVENILGTRNFDFDLRHDGAFTTKTPKAVASVTGVERQTQLLLTFASAPVTGDFVGDFIPRIVLPSESEHPNTPYRITSHASIVGVSVIVQTAEELADDISTTDAEIRYNEYTLPDTVRSVVRVSYRENDLSLSSVSATSTFDETHPNSMDEEGEPRTVAAGGFDLGAYDSVTGSEPDPKLRVILHPSPDDSYIVNYSYYYRHPELTEETSTLDGVPPGNVNDIIEEAAGIIGITWDGDLSMAHLNDRAQLQADFKQKSGSPRNSRRHRIGGWGAARRNINGFPGKTIGDA